MAILVTGAAGFIGYHTAQALLAAGHDVIGVDSLNAYYDPKLKRDRLERLKARPGFGFFEMNLADRVGMLGLSARLGHVTGIVHLAAQAGVRHSLADPYAYVEANVMGQVVMLELARLLPRLTHFVYASSSSVYGANAKIPFSIGDPVDHPMSAYAATKRAGELMAATYASLYGLPCTGLRFFTVYGPWGRPDMAYFSFVKAAFEGTPIEVFNNGEMRRDFTYIDDIVAGILGVLARPPVGAALYNLGNSKTEALGHFIAEIERATGRELVKINKPMQPGDVPATFADITESRADFGFDPKTTIAEGIPRFVEWYKTYYKVQK
jgi:UDP-glucuronate 4-epimerase